MKKIYLLLFAIPLLLSSCRPPLYFPNSVNVPLLKKKGDVSASIGGGSSGLQIQVAAAPSDHFAITADVMAQSSESNDYHSSTSLTGNSSYYTYTNGHNQVLADFGAGGFSTFQKHGVFEFFGGFGIGNSSSYGDNNSASSGITKIYFQTDIGTKGNVAEFAFSTRIAYLNLSRSGSSVNGDNEPISDIDGLVIEPAVTLRVGYKTVKFFVQTGLSISSDETLRMENEGGWFSGGLSLSFE